jgi:hypothetical protein
MQHLEDFPSETLSIAEERKAQRMKEMKLFLKAFQMNQNRQRQKYY